MSVRMKVGCVNKFWILRSFISFLLYIFYYIYLINIPFIYAYIKLLNEKLCYELFCATNSKVLKGRIWNCAENKNKTYLFYYSAAVRFLTTSRIRNEKSDENDFRLWCLYRVKEQHSETFSSRERESTRKFRQIW